MTSYFKAMMPTPEELERSYREFQADPSLDPVRARWLDEHRPDWREPSLSRDELEERIEASRGYRRWPWR